MYFSFKELLAICRLRLLQSMRVICIMITLVTGAAGALQAERAEGQNLLSLRLEKSTLKEALNKIEKQTTFRFVYNASEIAKEKGISYNARDQALNQVLNSLLVERGFSFKIIGTNILIKKEKTADSPAEVGKKETVTEPRKVVSISGRITDERDESLPGVNIQVKGTAAGTVSNAEGLYVIDAEPGDILVYSFVGYAAQEIKVGKSVRIDIRLETDQKQLNEIVVVGYGTRERKNLIGSVTKISPKEVRTIPEGSFDAQLQGKTPGVQISSNTGIPGSDVFIRVRGTTSINGNNSPLYIIDGVFVNSSSLQNIFQDRSPSPLADINPSDIESIEILKDANAVAIYGSRGANGVIIVSTKRGNYGERAKIDFNTSQGWSWAPPERAWKLTTGEEHAIIINELNANRGAVLPFRPVSEGGLGLPSEQKTYDRMALLNRTARLQNYDLSIRGGSKATKYYIGAGYESQQAIWRPIDFKRASLKINVDQIINEKLTIGTSNIISGVFRGQARAANGPNGTLHQASLHIPTYLPIFDENGVPLKWGTADNIAVLTKEANVKSTTARYIGNLYADWNILPKLRFRSSWSLDYTNYGESEHWGTDALLGAAPINGKAISSNTTALNWLNEQTLTYNNTIGRHNFGVLLGNHVQSNTVHNTTATGSNFPNNAFTLISSAANQTASELWKSYTLVSFFSGLNYSYNKKYLLEFTLRADASSKFGANNRWGYFPSVGAAWRIKDEEFLKENTFVSDLKLRTSYGVAGNQDGIDEFASKGLWNAGYGYPATSGGAENPGIAPLQSANPDLRWEKTSQFNIGLDLSLVKNRVTLEFNLYNKYTRDVLLEVAVPTTTGFSSYISNFGEISNKGFEFGIRTVNIQRKDFTWNTEFNVSQNRNNVEKIASPMSYGTRDVVRIEQGKPLYSYWLYKREGVDPQTGNVIYRDVNGDKQITAADRYLVGNTWPKLFGGLTNSFTYKGFDLGVFFTYSLGNYVYNLNRVFGERGGTLGANRVIFKSQMDRWTTPGQITNVPRLDANNYNIYQDSEFFENGSFLRLRQLSLGYQIPKNILAKVKIEKVRVYISATNLFLITPYSGADPETNMAVGGQNTQGYDYSLPPQPRSVQVGLNITL